MCGFCGFTGNVLDRDAYIKEMARLITHRGPDSEGYYLDDGIAMGFRRLSIIDIEAANQPLYNEDKSLVLMKFPGVDDMNAALALKGKNLYIRRADAKLPEGACFDAELLGMTVCDAATGETLGEITRVDSYPAHKVYTVRGAREYLIPAVPDVFIKSVDLDANRMEVQVWEGMATDEN